MMIVHIFLYIYMFKPTTLISWFWLHGPSVLSSVFYENNLRGVVKERFFEVFDPKKLGEHVRILTDISLRLKTPLW